MNQEFSVVTAKKEDRIEGALKANYKTKKYGFTGTFGSTGLVSILLFGCWYAFEACWFSCLVDGQQSVQLLLSSCSVAGTQNRQCVAA